MFNGELDNGHYDALFSLEEKITGIFYEVFHMQPSPKTLRKSTAYKRKLRAFTNRMTMKIFRLKGDEVTAGWRKKHVKELHDLFYSPNIITVIKL